MSSPQTLRLAVAQAHTLSTTTLTLSALTTITRAASSQNVDLLLFPEAYLGGYPRTATFGSAIGARHPEGKEQFLHYFKDAVDLGDTPEGAGERWVRRELEVPRDDVNGEGSGGKGGRGVRGDGTREYLEDVARETGVFLVVGLIERCAGTLYCGVVYVCPRLGVVGKRRKVMPTGSERLVWGQGQPASLRAVTTTIKGVKLTLAAAICWENYMPLLRQSLYSQNVNLYCAPTADARDTWLPLLRTIASEGRCVVLSANQCMAEDKLPEWITGKKTTGKEAEETPTINGNDQEREIVNLSNKQEDKSGAVVPDKSDRRSSGTSRFPSKTRRKSTVTDDGHEIILPGVAETSEAIEEESPNGSIKEQPALPSRLRRASTVTDDGHEIALPKPKSTDSSHADNTTSKIPPDLFKRRKSTVTQDGHEIVFPDIKESTPVASETKQVETKPKLICRGGSCIVSSTAEVLAGPLWDDENGLLISDVDFDDCLRGRLDLDVAGSYSRNDAFKLTVQGLDLSPPP